MGSVMTQFIAGDPPFAVCCKYDELIPMASFGDATIFLFSFLNTILFTMLDIANYKPLGHGKHNVIDRDFPFHISLSSCTHLQ